MGKTRHWAILPGCIGLLILAFAGVGEGQQGIGGPGEGVKLALLRLPSVQKELNLTAKQKSEIARIGEETKAAKKQIESVSKAQEKDKTAKVPKGMPDPVRDAREAAFAELERNTDGTLKKILDKEQRVRLLEIALQVEGPQAFLKPEIIVALDIIEDQVQQIQAILGQVNNQQDQLKAAQKRAADVGSVDLEKQSKEQQKAQARAYGLSLGKKAMTEIGKVLSKKQKDKYTRMLGEPFNLAGLTDEKGQKLFDPSGNLFSTLLDMPAVLDELKLTPAQKLDLDRDVPASKVLTATQKTRLTQIELQSAGPAVFTRSEVIASLRLNDDQVEEIQAILNGLGEARRQLRDAQKTEDAARKAEANFDPEAPAEKTRKEQAKTQFRTNADKMNQGVMSKVAAVLTRSQREAFRKQLGEPFDLSKLRPAPPAPPAGGEVPPR